MKKTFLLIALAVFGLTMAACGGNKDEKKDGEKAKVETTQESNMGSHEGMADDSYDMDEVSMSDYEEAYNKAMNEYEEAYNKAMNEYEDAYNKAMNEYENMDIDF